MGSGRNPANLIETHKVRGRTSKLHTDDICGSNVGPSNWKVAMLTAAPPCCPLALLIMLSVQLFVSFLHCCLAHCLLSSALSCSANDYTFPQFQLKLLMHANDICILLVITSFPLHVIHFTQKWPKSSPASHNYFFLFLGKRRICLIRERGRTGRKPNKSITLTKVEEQLWRLVGSFVRVEDQWLHKTGYHLFTCIHSSTTRCAIYLLSAAINVLIPNLTFLSFFVSPDSSCCHELIVSLWYVPR